MIYIILIFLFLIVAIKIKNKINSDDEISIPSKTEELTSINSIDTHKLESINKINYYEPKAQKNPLNFDDFEHKYYDRFYSKIEEYADLCEITFGEFEENFNIDFRIKRLESCINKMDRLKKYYSDLGENGIKLYKQIIADSYPEIEADWSQKDIMLNKNGDDYEFEFEKIEHCTFSFIVYLHHLYTSDKNNQKEHLKQEQLFHDICYLHGGDEAYAEFLEEQERIKSLKKEITSTIKKSEKVLQSELTKGFDDTEKKIIREHVNELYSKGKISKDKSGNTYLLTWKNKDIGGAMKNTTWEQWNEVHDEPDQLKRQKSAAGTPCTPVSINKEELSGSFQGKSGHHTTTLDQCSCIDFNRRRKPCKHMYRLAMELGLFAGEFKSKKSDIVRTKPKSGYSIADAVKIIETLSSDEQTFLHDILYKMKFKYHSEYAPIKYSDLKKYKKIFDLNILEESKNTDFLIETVARNTLNNRIIELEPDLKFNKNMKQKELAEWIRQNIPQHMDTMCKHKTSVIVADTFLKSKHKMYMYLHRIQILEHGIENNYFAAIGDLEEPEPYTLPDDDITVLLKEYGHVKE